MCMDRYFQQLISVALILVSLLGLQLLLQLVELAACHDVGLIEHLLHSHDLKTILLYHT